MVTGSATAGGSSSRQQDDKVLPLSGEVIYLPNDHFHDLGISIMRLRAKVSQVKRYYDTRLNDS
jgi:hypothetical protein